MNKRDYARLNITDDLRRDSFRAAFCFRNPHNSMPPDPAQTAPSVRGCLYHIRIVRSIFSCQLPRPVKGRCFPMKQVKMHLTQQKSSTVTAFRDRSDSDIEQYRTAIGTFAIFLPAALIKLKSHKSHTAHSAFRADITIVFRCGGCFRRRASGYLFLARFGNHFLLFGHDLSSLFRTLRNLFP